MFGHPFLRTYFPSVCAHFLISKSLWIYRNEICSLKLVMVFCHQFIAIAQHI